MTGAELDFLQSHNIKQKGCFGCRMVGAGFGGCVIAIYENEETAKAAIEIIKKEYLKEFGIENSAFISTVGCGAKILE